MVNLGLNHDGFCAEDSRLNALTLSPKSHGGEGAEPVKAVPESLFPDVL